MDRSLYILYQCDIYSSTAVWAAARRILIISTLRRIRETFWKHYEQEQELHIAGES